MLKSIFVIKFYLFLHKFLNNNIEFMTKILYIPTFKTYT